MVTIKRHSEKEGEGPSHKHFLSEEGMAARFTCLSLSNDHVYGSNGFPIARGQLHTDKERHFQDLERRSDPPGMVTIKRHSEKEGEAVSGDPPASTSCRRRAWPPRFTCLSLSNDHVYGSNGFPVARGQLHTDKERHFQDLERRIALGGEWGIDSTDKKDVIVEGMFDMSDSRVIVVSSAIQRRLESPLEDILPREVLWSMSHPCTELILWQPPGNVIERAIRALRLDGDGRGPGRERGIVLDRDTRQSAGGSQRPEDEMEL
ncbi:uncharacterized protein [Heptranchias perlo]|uniref:uncharacterized protein n=1 Tax=Heptranchias perlo TaxID=212740 RepID=UPI00355A1C41